MLRFVLKNPHFLIPLKPDVENFDALLPHAFSGFIEFLCHHSSFDGDKINLLYKLQEHIGPDSTYLHKVDIAKRLNFIFYLMQQSDDHDWLMALSYKIIERLTYCSSGFYNEIYAISNKLLLQDGIEGLLYETRQEMVDQIACRFSDETHAQNAVTIIAANDFGIKPRNIDDPYYASPHPDILDTLQAHFNLINFMYNLELVYRSRFTCLGYSGVKTLESPYSESVKEAFIDLILSYFPDHPNLQAYQQHLPVLLQKKRRFESAKIQEKLVEVCDEIRLLHHEVFRDFFILEDEDDIDYLIDINWPAIMVLLFQEILSRDYYNFTENQKNVILKLLSEKVISVSMYPVLFSFGLDDLLFILNFLRCELDEAFKQELVIEIKKNLAQIALIHGMEQNDNELTNLMLAWFVWFQLLGIVDFSFVQEINLPLLHLFLEYGEIELVRKCISAGFDINYVYQGIPFIAAVIKYQNWELFSFLEVLGVDFNVTVSRSLWEHQIYSSPDDYSLLHIAVSFFDEQQPDTAVKILQKLIGCGLHLSILDSEGTNLLMFASYANNYPVIKYLLENHEDLFHIGQQNQKGDNTFIIAFLQQHEYLTRYLLSLMTNIQDYLTSSQQKILMNNIFSQVRQIKDVEQLIFIHQLKARGLIINLDALFIAAVDVKNFMLASFLISEVSEETIKFVWHECLIKYNTEFILRLLDIFAPRPSTFIIEELIFESLVHFIVNKNKLALTNALALFQDKHFLNIEFRDHFKKNLFDYAIEVQHQFAVEIMLSSIKHQPINFIKTLRYLLLKTIHEQKYGLASYVLLNYHVYGIRLTENLKDLIFKALYAFIQGNHSQIIPLEYLTVFIEHGFDLNMINEAGETLLYLSLLHDNVPALSYFFSLKPQLFYVALNEQKLTPLGYAFLEKKTRVANFLLMWLGLNKEHISLIEQELIENILVWFLQEGIHFRIEDVHALSKIGFAIAARNFYLNQLVETALLCEHLQLMSFLLQFNQDEIALFALLTQAIEFNKTLVICLLIEALPEDGLKVPQIYHQVLIKGIKALMYVCDVNVLRRLIHLLSKRGYNLTHVHHNHSLISYAIDAQQDDLLLELIELYGDFKHLVALYAKTAHPILGHKIRDIRAIRTNLLFMLSHHQIDELCCINQLYPKLIIGLLLEEIDEIDLEKLKVLINPVIQLSIYERLKLYQDALTNPNIRILEYLFFYLELEDNRAANFFSLVISEDFRLFKKLFVIALNQKNLLYLDLMIKACPENQRISLVNILYQQEELAIEIKKFVLLHQLILKLDLSINYYLEQKKDELCSEIMTIYLSEPYAVQYLDFKRLMEMHSQLEFVREYLKIKLFENKINVEDLEAQNLLSCVLETLVYSEIILLPLKTQLQLLGYRDTIFFKQALGLGMSEMVTSLIYKSEQLQYQTEDKSLYITMLKCVEGLWILSFQHPPLNIDLFYQEYLALLAATRNVLTHKRNFWCIKSDSELLLDSFVEKLPSEVQKKYCHIYSIQNIFENMAQGVCDFMFYFICCQHSDNEPALLAEKKRL